MLASHPNLKAALELFPGTSEPVAAKISTTINAPPPQKTRSRSQSRDYDFPPAKIQKQESSYVLDFGLHKGKQLSEVSSNYVFWLKQNIDDKTKLATPALTAALQDLPTLSTDRWTPPNIDGAPAKFWDEWTYKQMWISAGDARKIFGMNWSFLAQLPLVNKRAKRRKRYFLYHVWDFFKFNTSEAKADAALKEFMKQKDDRTEDIWGAMGLGACLCNDNGNDVPYP